MNKVLNDIFEYIKNDDVTSLMPLIIQHNLINIRFPRNFNKTFSQDYPILSHFPSVVGIASYFGSFDVFRFLVSNNADLSLFDDNNMNSIGFAVAGDNIDIIEQLFEMNLIDQSFSNQFLLYCCQFNSLNSLRTYIDRLEFDPEYSDLSGKKCIHYAALNGNIEMMKLLLDHGAKINSPTNNDLRTPLMFASVINKPEVVEFILSIDGVDPAAKTKFNDSALILASATGYIENIKLLLSTGKIDINDQNSNGASALHIAVINNRIDLIKFYLQQKGINAEITDLSNMTPLTKALFLKNKEAMVVLHHHLREVEKKSEDDISIFEGQSLVHMAANMNSPEFLDLLINEWKEDVNAEKCKSNKSPLFITMENGFMDALIFLIKTPGRKLGKVPTRKFYNGETFAKIKPEVSFVLKSNGGEDILSDFVSQLDEFNEKNKNGINKQREEGVVPLNEEDDGGDEDDDN